METKDLEDKFPKSFYFKLGFFAVFIALILAAIVALLLVSYQHAPFLVMILTPAWTIVGLFLTLFLLVIYHRKVNLVGIFFNLISCVLFSVVMMFIVIVANIYLYEHVIYL